MNTLINVIKLILTVGLDENNPYLMGTYNNDMKCVKAWEDGLKHGLSVVLKYLQENGYDDENQEEE